MHDAELLRSRGLRVTRPRLAALAALRREGHLTADEVRNRIGDDGRPVSVQAVYDVLTTLTREGLVRRIEPAGSAARYEVRTGDNHHHLVCRTCGSIEDVDCATGAPPCLDPSSDHGFQVDEAEITFWGTCPRCLGDRPSTTTPPAKGPM
ncbi:MAG: Fur family transcriptional regulator [Nocardioidaceae bacterium]